VAEIPSITEHGIPGGWTEQSLVVGGRPMELIVPADADEFLNELDNAHAPPEVLDPYWARLWPTAQTLAEWVIGRHWPANQEALDLGCGVGLVGLAGLCAGLQMTFADHLPVAVQLALENARRNGFSSARGLVLDWRKPPVHQFFVILASDILYDPHLHESLVSAIDKLLVEHGTCLIADPGRYHVRSFLEQCAKRRFEVTLTSEDGTRLMNATAGEYQLIELRRAT
jgi:predicted nicotinamide N-methyase